MSDLFVQLSDERLQLTTTMRIEAGYSPDVITDMVNRTVWAYKAAVDHQVQKIGVPPTEEYDGEDDD